MNNEFLVDMGTRIAQCRKSKAITQEKLAEKMNVSLQTISCIELGKKAIRPENLVNLCNVLDVSSDYILFGRRSEQQVSKTVEKLSVLGENEYKIVQDLIDILYNRI